MITYLAGFQKDKDAAFASIAEADGGGRRLITIPWSLKGYPETEAVTAEAMSYAKRLPASAWARASKARLIAGQYNGSRRYFEYRPNHVAVCWNGLTGSRMAFMEGARAAGAARLFVELAPFPDRISLDPGGLAGDASLPRDPAFYRDWAKGHGFTDWRALGAKVTARASRRRDVGQSAGELPDTPFLFAPLQVPNDSQITRFGGWTGSVEGFVGALAEASAALPDGWHIRVKEHPSAKVALGDRLQEMAGDRLVIDNATDTFAQVAASRGVVTINSSVGLQAMFHDKPVLVLGRAYFAIEGVTHPVGDAEALREMLSSPQDLGFDPDLRAAFVSYLDAVYFPRTAPWSRRPIANRPRRGEVETGRRQGARTVGWAIPSTIPSHFL